MPGGDTDYYADLGLTKEATSAEITKAFRKLALLHHPDRGGDPEQFTRINKAHEVLSDAKARARYDGTGRTTPLTPEEEFREAFFGGFGGGDDKRSSRGAGGKQASEAERQEAKQREQERQEAQRRLDEADRRDAERRARLAGGAPAPPQASAPAAQAAATPKSDDGQLMAGTRVKIHSLSSRPELNGLTGMLVAQVQEKWQVRLDNDGSEKLMKAKNLARVGAPPAAGPKASPAPQSAPAAAGCPTAAAPKAGPARGATQGSAKAAPPPMMPSEQPTHRYQIITDFAYVRQDPVPSAQAYGTKKRGEFVTAAEETFDGWVHLADEPGWIIKDMQGRQGIGEVLAAVGGTPVLAIPKPLGKGGPVTFEVVFKPQIVIRSGPSKSATARGYLKFGEKAVAELQTYGGWVRLKGEKNHWVLTNDPTFGQLLSANETQARANIQERESALKDLDLGVRGKNPGLIQQALARCRANGVDKAQTQYAETALANMKAEEARREAKAKEFLQRVERVKGSEKDLRECIDDGSKAGYKEGTQLAQKLLEELQAARSKEQQKHSGLLERLAAAAASGDKAEMKAARDAAVKGGVDKKEVARIFSLNVINAAEKPSQVPSNMPAPSSEPVRELTGPSPGEEEPDETAILYFALGVRVRIRNLEKRKELNGVTGVLVAQREGAWQVMLFNGAGMKVVKESNLVPYDKNSEPPPSLEAAMPPKPARMEEPSPSAEDPNPAGEEPSAAEGAKEPSSAGAALVFSGRWVSLDGEWMGTVEGTSIQWADGPLVELAILSEREFSCEMSAEGVTETFSAKLDDEGRLVWCDGDVWVLSRA